MAKVGGQGDDETNDVLWDGATFTIRAIPDGDQLPALTWLESLDGEERECFDAASTILDNSRRSGRPTSQRIQPVKSSSCGLTLFRVTPRGSKPPHLRLLHLLHNSTL